MAERKGRWQFLEERRVMGHQREGDETEREQDEW